MQSEHLCTSNTYYSFATHPLLLKVLNCKLKYSNPESHLFGSVVNGTATGVYAEVAFGRADIATGGLGLSYGRLQVTDELE